MKLPQWSAIILALAAWVLVAREPASAQKAHAKASVPAAAQKAHAKAAPSAAVDPLAGRSFGSKTAPITIETFSDFQCPACRSLYQAVQHKLMDDYVATGKVYLIHRDFPLPMHAHSREAAQYAVAAARLGKFEKVEEALFNKQDVWEKDGSIDAVVAAVLTPAEMVKVRKLVKSGQLDAEIESDVSRGKNYAVNQTPTMVITSRGQTYPIASVVTYDLLRNFLDQLLK
ncbi:MAG TPA: thioredoxin domain-containing protein [Candidatus Dormibacteraeota bacterium]|nr:thioredoxin domain-containing protein [Candidatus Dormibacteraeota bacterium]